MKEFGAATSQLHEIAIELKNAGVTTAAMEATGIYWIPLFDLLEDYGLGPVLVDPKTCKNAPGRKTDTLDCQWIQTLWSNGMLRAAYRPPRDYLPLRALVRDRQNVVKMRQTALLHMEKALQLMNIKLSDALSDIAGISGLDIIRAIAAGERDPRKLAALRKRGVKKKEDAFIEALNGTFQIENIRFLQRALRSYDYAGGELQICDQLIREELEKLPSVVDTLPPEREKNKDSTHKNFRKPKKNDLSFDARTLLWQKAGVDFTALPGIQANTALVIFAELGGANVDAWDSEKAFASWLKLCPGNNVSGGQRRKCKSQPCANRISQSLRMAALSAKQSRSAIGDRIRRVCSKTDNIRGIKAGAHKLAILIYQMCKCGWQYHEKGESYYEEKSKERKLKALKKHAKDLGFTLVAA